MSTLPRTLRLPLVACVIILAALLAACGGPEIPLNGTIIDAYTGKPVPAATINLGGAQLSTDAGGKYQVAQWSEKDTLQIAANGYEPISIVLASFVGMLFVSFMFSPLASFLPELFATRVRVTGASLGFQFAGVFGGALAPIIATSLVAKFDSTTPVAVYLAIVCAIIVVSAIAARETAHANLEDVGEVERTPLAAGVKAA